MLNRDNIDPKSKVKIGEKPDYLIDLDEEKRLREEKQKDEEKLRKFGKDSSRDNIDPTSKVKIGEKPDYLIDMEEKNKGF